MKKNNFSSFTNHVKCKISTHPVFVNKKSLKNKQRYNKKKKKKKKQNTGGLAQNLASLIKNE